MSSSRRVGTQAPTAFTWAPSAIHAPWTTGAADEVTVQTMWAPSTAARTDGAASTGTPWRSDASSAKRRARSASRPHTRTRRIGRTSSIASRCVRACTPVPTIASSVASSRARARVATADAAAVRMAVTAVASTTASSRPCTSSNKRIAP